MIKLGPDDRQRQHVADCKPDRNTPPSRIGQTRHTIPQSHQILVVSLNRHHVTLGLPLSRSIWEQKAYLIFTIICLNTTRIVPITIALHRIVDRGSSSCSLFTSSSQTKHSAHSSQSRLPTLDPKNYKDAAVRISSSTLSICKFFEHYTLSKQSLQLRDSRCNNNPLQ